MIKSKELYLPKITLFRMLEENLRKIYNFNITFHNIFVIFTFFNIFE